MTSQEHAEWLDEQRERQLQTAIGTAHAEGVLGTILVLFVVFSFWQLLSTLFSAAHERTDTEVVILQQQIDSLSRQVEDLRAEVRRNELQRIRESR